MRRLQILAVATVLVCAIGCSGGKYAPVSGMVTLDGKPYDNAVVSFQPMGTDNNQNPGRGSSAYTDGSGRFVLVSDENNGAIVGKHRVRIMTRGNHVVGASPEGGTPDETPTTRPVDPIPAEWNSLSKVEFEVPPGGTDKANFDINTKR